MSKCCRTRVRFRAVLILSKVELWQMATMDRMKVLGDYETLEFGVAL